MTQTLNRKQKLFLINYMNQKRKKVRLDQIKQKQNSQSELDDKNKRHFNSSGGESDFSEFELGPKDINNDFSQFKKPKLWDKLVNKTIKVQRQIKNKHKQQKKVEKIEQSSSRKNKKQVWPENIVQQLVSFKKNTPEDQKKSDRSGSNNKSLKNQKQNKDYCQQLIQEYDKSQFNNKAQKRQIEVELRTLERSRRQQRQSQIKNKELVEASGGVCFDVTITDFAFKDDTNRKRKKAGSRRKGSEGGQILRRKSSGVGNDIFEKQEILRRRQIAFVYGEMARRRTFGYY